MNTSNITVDVKVRFSLLFRVFLIFLPFLWKIKIVSEERIEKTFDRIAENAFYIKLGKGKWRKSSVKITYKDFMSDKE